MCVINISRCLCVRARFVMRARKSPASGFSEFYRACTRYTNIVDECFARERGFRHASSLWICDDDTSGGRGRRCSRTILLDRGKTRISFIRTTELFREQPSDHVDTDEWNVSAKTKGKSRAPVLMLHDVPV